MPIKRHRGVLILKPYNTKLGSQATGGLLMQQGSIFIVLTFPKPWPPIQPTSLLSQGADSDRVCLTADPSGRLKFSVIHAGKVITDYTFQPIDIEGDGRSIVSIIWTPDGASLNLNSQELKLDIDAGGERHMLRTSVEPVNRGYIFQDRPKRGEIRGRTTFLGDARRH